MKANKRWIFLFTHLFSEEEMNREKMITLAEKLVRHHVNMFIICDELSPQEYDYAKEFKQEIENLNKEYKSCEVYLVSAMKSENVELYMERRVTNYKMTTNNPLIIETLA